MLCQKCNQNEASTFVKKVINGNVYEAHLCSECAKKLGYSNMLTMMTPDLGGLISGLFASPFTTTLANPTRCNICGSSFNDIINSGKTGCANCYTIFARELMPTIKKLHGNTVHCGKGVKASSCVSEETVDVLKAELKKAIDTQEFEKAAELRDRIKEMEDQNKGGSLNE